MAGPVEDEVMLGLIASEAAAREAALAGLQDLVNELGVQIGKFSFELKQLQNYVKNGKTFTASALVGRLDYTQVGPGYALAEDLLELQAEVTGNNTDALAKITDLFQVVATETSARATEVKDISARFQQNQVITNASINQTAIAAANANSATASLVTTLTARVDGHDTSLATINTTLVAQATTNSAVASSITSLTATVAANTAAITTESTARATADSAMATSITSLTATVGTKIKTFIGGTAPTASEVGDLWVDTSTGFTLKRWDGSAWVDTTVANGAINAAVLIEATARATADGYATAKYTLAVTAGNVVTGMNLTSSTGPGTNYSGITFQTDHLFVQTATGPQTSLVDISAAGFVFGTDIASNNYSSGTAGWKLTRAGNLEANAGTFRGTVDVGSGYTHLVVDTGKVEYGDTAHTSPVVGFYQEGSGTSAKVIIAGTTVAKLYGSYNAGTGTKIGILSLTDDASDIVALSPTAITFTNGSSGSNTVTLGLAPGNAIHTGPHHAMDATTQAKYALCVVHNNNATGKYGLFIGTSWNAAENRLLTVGNVDATPAGSGGTGAITDRFVITGDGFVTLNGRIQFHDSGSTGASGLYQFQVNGDVVATGDIFLGTGGTERWLIDCNGNRLLKKRMALVPTTLADCITVLQTHGLCS